MQAKEVVVRLSALDGVWEVGGVDRKRGIVPENVSLTSDLWGSATASFDLRRNPRAIWPDIGAFTPIDISVGGKLVWSGRISGTPSRDSTDRVINVQAVGWQYHLDDDLYEKTYVHTRLSDWQDMRTFPTAELSATRALAAGQVSNDNGTIQIAFPKDTVLAGGAYVGVVLDLGPNSTAASLSFDYETSNAGSHTLYVRSHTAPDSVAWTINDVVNGEALTSLGASGSRRGTFATPDRYVVIFLYAAAVTAPADVWVKLKAIRVFTNDSWRSTDASVLKASDVITDALTQATVLLSADRSQITATSFAIPDFSLTAPATPREAWSAVNAYHDYISQVDVLKRPVFKAKPTSPMFEVGAWSPLELQDQSANSGDDIYNRVIVTGTGPDGTPSYTTRISAQQAGAGLVRGEVATSWASGGSATPTDNVGAVLAPVRAGTPFLVVVNARSGAPNTSYPNMGSSGQTVTLTIGNQGSSGLSGYGDYAQFSFSPDQPGPLYFLWTPVKDHTDSVEVRVDRSPTTGSGGIFVDIYRGKTLVDRRGFTRTKTLPVNSAITTAAAQQIGDLWLAAHKTTPYKGTFQLTGDQAIRDPTTGTYLPLERLLIHTGELIRDTNAIDPDTGGVGRDGRIAQVTYTPASNQATVTLDNSRASFEALLARFDLISSVGK